MTRIMLHFNTISIVQKSCSQTESQVHDSASLPSPTLLIVVRRRRHALLLEHRHTHARGGKRRQTDRHSLAPPSACPSSLTRLDWDPIIPLSSPPSPTSSGGVSTAAAAAIVISVTYLAHSRSRSVGPSSGALSPLSLLVAVVGAHAQCSPPSLPLLLFGGVDVDVVVAAAAAAVLRISCVFGSLHHRPAAPARSLDHLPQVFIASR